MRTFKDNEGREWTIDVHTTSIKRVRDLTGVDLLEIQDLTIIDRLSNDPVLLVDVVYAACKPQADERAISDEQFGCAMAGDVIEAATKALLEELVAFSPSPRDRKNLGRVIEATTKAKEKARDLIEAKIDSGVLDQIIDEALADAGDSSGSAPESSESIRAP